MVCVNAVADSGIRLYLLRWKMTRKKKQSGGRGAIITLVFGASADLAIVAAAWCCP